MKAQYKALIIDTILKEARSKTLIFIFIATTAAIVIGHMVLSAVIGQMGGEASFSMSGVDVLSVNFRILNSISFIIAAVFGVSVFRSDFENNIIYQYLSFPISRTEYFFIRVLGTWLLVMAYYLYAYVLSGVLFSMAFKKVIFTPAYFFSFSILSVYLLLVIFIAIFFSLMMNKLGALFITFCTSIAAAGAFGTFSKLPYGEFFSDMGAMKSLGLLVYYLFPRLSFLDAVSSHLLLANPASGGLELNLIEQVLHLIIATGAYVYLANHLVKKKDF